MSELGKPQVDRGPECTCKWTQEDDGSWWNTSCNKAFVINEGPPSENKMQYCCYCGGRLVEVPYVEEAEDE